MSVSGFLMSDDSKSLETVSNGCSICRALQSEYYVATEQRDV